MHIKDLGISIDSSLTFEGHFQHIIAKANMMAGLIRRSFCHLDEDIFVYLYKALVRPHLEYAHVVCHPYKQKHIDALESVQRRATRYVPSLKGGRPLERGQDQDRLRKQIMSFRHSVRGQV